MADSSGPKAAVGAIVTTLIGWTRSTIGALPFIGTPLANIVVWVILSIATMIDQVIDGILWLAQQATNVVADALSLLSSAVGALTSFAQDLDHWARVDLWGWITSAVSSIEHDVFIVADWIANAAETVAGWINATVFSALDYIYTNWVKPVEDWVSNAAETVGTWIAEVVYKFWTDVVVPIAHDVATALYIATQLFDWFLHEASDAVALVIKAGDYLLWMALHPFAFFDQLTGYGSSKGQHWIGTWAAALLAQPHDLLDSVLAKVIDEL